MHIFLSLRFGMRSGYHSLKGKYFEGMNYFNKVPGSIFYSKYLYMLSYYQLIDPLTATIVARFRSISRPLRGAIFGIFTTMMEWCQNSNITTSLSRFKSRWWVKLVLNALKSKLLGVEVRYSIGVVGGISKPFPPNIYPCIQKSPLSNCRGSITEFSIFLHSL